MRCIYCLATDRGFSREHIWPEALGGKFLPALITDEVCRKCNNLCGVYVDGAFIKNVFMQAEGTTIFRYLGRPEIPKIENRVCELWRFTSGFVCHWVSSNEEFQAYVGIDPREKKTRSFLYFTELPSPEQASEILKQFLSKFKRTKGFAGNFPIPDGVSKLFDVANDEAAQREHYTVSNFIASLDPSETNLAVQVHLQIDFSERFMAKLCLALGHKFLDDRYLDTNMAAELRGYLWQRNAESCLASNVMGKNFSLELSPISQLISSRGQWTLLVVAEINALSLVVITPSGKIMQMLISDEPRLWAHLNFNQFLDGKVYVVDPNTNKARSDIPLMSFIHEAVTYCQKAVATPIN